VIAADRFVSAAAGNPLGMTPKTGVAQRYPSMTMELPLGVLQEEGMFGEAGERILTNHRQVRSGLTVAK